MAAATEDEDGSQQPVLWLIVSDDDDDGAESLHPEEQERSQGRRPPKLDHGWHHAEHRGNILNAVLIIAQLKSGGCMPRDALSTTCWGRLLRAQTAHYCQCMFLAN